MSLLTKYKATKTYVDSNGLKTTSTITTENVDIMKRIINSSKEEVNQTRSTNSNAGTRNNTTTRSTTRKKTTSLLNEPKIKVKPSTKTSGLILNRNSNKSTLTQKSISKKLNETLQLHAPKKKKSTINKNVKLKGKANIVHNSRNLNEKQIQASNNNSEFGDRGNWIKDEYEIHRKQIEFSSLNISQKNKLLDKLYKYFSDILYYDSQVIPLSVAGYERYQPDKMRKITDKQLAVRNEFCTWWDRGVVQTLRGAKAKRDIEYLKKKKGYF